MSVLSFYGGDWCWGPRYFVVVLPLLALAFPFASFTRPAERVVVRTLIAAGLAVQLLAISVDHHRFFYERSLPRFFWSTDRAFYFRHSALFARPGEIWESLTSRRPGRGGRVPARAVREPTHLRGVRWLGAYRRPPATVDALLPCVLAAASVAAVAGDDSHTRTTDQPRARVRGGAGDGGGGRDRRPSRRRCVAGSGRAVGEGLTRRRALTMATPIDDPRRDFILDRRAPRRLDAPELEVSVVIPCLNEAPTIGPCIRKALDAMAANGINGEVVVSDNGSTDASIEISKAEGARVVSCPTRGYGAALQFGFRHARGKHVLMADGDQSYDLSLVPRFIAATRSGSSFVMGSRLRGRIEDGAMPPLHRYLGTPVLTWILNRLFGTRISDCNCGMRCVDRQAFFRLGVISPGMEFASEMVVKAAVHGVAITEVPIDFYKDRRNRRPHLRPFHDGWRHLRLLLWHAPDHMMTVPGLVMLAVGLLLVLSQLAGPGVARVHQPRHPLHDSRRHALAGRYFGDVAGSRGRRDDARGSCQACARC